MVHPAQDSSRARRKDVTMIPPRILEAFSAVPGELIELCRPHSWDALTTPPGEGLRSIRDVLVHLVSAEAYWIDFVIHRGERRRFDPATYASLDAILTPWTERRRRTVAFVQSLSTQEREQRRPFPWDASASATIEEIVWHVVTHEQYHRGQIFTRLALLGRRDLPDHDLLR